MLSLSLRLSCTIRPTHGVYHCSSLTLNNSVAEVLMTHVMIYSIPVIRLDTDKICAQTHASGALGARAGQTALRTNISVWVSSRFSPQCALQSVQTGQKHYCIAVAVRYVSTHIRLRCAKLVVLCVWNL